LKDLVTHDSERDLLWHALRDRASNSSLYRVKSQVDIELDPEILVLLAGLEQNDQRYEPSRD
jgi:hypothetical protein